MKEPHRRNNSLGVYAFPLIAALAFSTACAKPAPATLDLQPAPAAARKEEPPKVRFPKPDVVKGIYLTAWSAGSSRKMEKVLAMIKRTELNSVVIDVRDDGENYWKNEIASSAEVGANKTAVVKPEALMAKLERAGVYPIARIACFRDQVVPTKMPQRAVNKTGGGIWKDRSNHSWLDPYNKKNWAYIAEVVDHALEFGFPEIQLDYVRFPSEGKSATMIFPAKTSYDKPSAKPTEVVAAFAEFIGERVRKKGAVLSADIFGIVSSGGGDQGIGQELQAVAAPFDLICPMVYPSHFAKGEYGIKDPNSSPYAIVLKSMMDYAKKLPEKKIRPWLQDFSLGVKYGEAEVRAQMKAAAEAGYTEYLLWNARNQYTESALVPKKPAGGKSPPTAGAKKPVR
jgi:hypothetical protein